MKEQQINEVLAKLEEIAFSEDHNEVEIIFHEKKGFSMLYHSHYLYLNNENREELLSHFFIHDNENNGYYEPLSFEMFLSSFLIHYEDQLRTKVK